MLTATLENTVSSIDAVTQIETLPSDVEISRRVLAIRNGWSLEERVSRRRVANERFNALIDALALAEAA